MDTSKEYIKMCDCPEVQGKWRYKHDNVVSTADGIFSDLRNRSLKGKYTWLPRQDQIQEMVEPTLRRAKTFERDWHVIASEMWEWRGQNGAYVANLLSMEQLWLVFYMQEKHGVEWDGKNWIKSKAWRY